jgi:hypothetical protein
LTNIVKIGKIVSNKLTWWETESRRQPPTPRGDTSKSARFAALGHIKVLAALTLRSRAVTQSRSPSPTAVRSANRVTLRGSILGPWPARPKMGSHDGVVPWLHCTRRQVGSNYNSKLGSPTFHISSSFPLTSLAVCRRPQPFILLSSSSTSSYRKLHFHRSLALVLYP